MYIYIYIYTYIRVITSIFPKIKAPPTIIHLWMEFSMKESICFWGTPMTSETTKPLDRPWPQLGRLDLPPAGMEESPCSNCLQDGIWVNYNISPTWIEAIWGWFPLLTMIIVRETSEVVIIYPDGIIMDNPITSYKNGIILAKMPPVCQAALIQSHVRNPRFFWFVVVNDLHAPPKMALEVLTPKETRSKNVDLRKKGRPINGSINVAVCYSRFDLVVPLNYGLRGGTLLGGFKTYVRHRINLWIHLIIV